MALVGARCAGVDIFFGLNRSVVRIACCVFSVVCRVNFCVANAAFNLGLRFN